MSVRSNIISFSFCAANACKLPVGTVSGDATGCNYDGNGCTVADLSELVTEVTCSAGYHGSPTEAGSVCNADGKTFTGGTYCLGAVRARVCVCLFNIK